ncbi:unnamed protein product, partial [Mesocestoides corti]|uniref:HD-GYP domain-containing protein n=1 Tax=Mesocestoides corti TaxID=53468 RepID=A0A0R3UDP7_MESCO
MVSRTYRGKSAEAIQRKTVKHVLLSLTAEEVRRYGHLIDRPLAEVEDILSQDPRLTRTSQGGRHQRTWHPPESQRFQSTRGSSRYRPPRPAPRQQYKSVDTGSGCSLVNPRRFPPKTFQPYLVASSINVKAANGTIMRSKGCVDIALTITGSVYQHTLYLCQDMPYD